jgi:hypothetical protein
MLASAACAGSSVAEDEPLIVAAETTPQDTTTPRLAAPDGPAAPHPVGSADQAPVQSPDTISPAAQTPRSDTARADQAARGHPATRPAPGWPVEGPEPMPGAILPNRRIVAYYGNPLSTRMGILGEIPPDQMLARLDQQIAEWREADPGTPVVPALHLVAIVAQASPMRDGKYRLKMPDSLMELVGSWAEKRNALVFLDIQVGLSNVQAEVPRLAEFLRRPNVHLGLDPEFSMKDGTPPGRKIGTMDASDINWTVNYLAELVREHNLPPKVLVVHRFTRPMLTNTSRIQLNPAVQIVIHMDGFGAPWLKRDSYLAYVQREPVQYAGFKVFYHNDSRGGSRIMTPAEILELFPQPVYIQYQ